MAQEDETEELPTAYGVMIAVITGLLGYVLWPTIFGTVASDLNPKDGNSRRVS
ncbi:GSCOCG00005897001-RA-CDS, partial [Cotesia congregata]